ESLADEEILAGVYSSADRDNLRLIARQVEPSLLVASYAGWGGAVGGRIRGGHLAVAAGAARAHLPGRRRSVGRRHRRDRPRRHGSPPQDRHARRPDRELNGTELI